MAAPESSSDPDPQARWVEWRPANVPNVVGFYTERVLDPVTGLPEPQEFRVACETCQAVWRSSCSSGVVRRHIQNFAARHQHRDPLEAPRIVRPGSLRSTGS